MRRQKTRFNPIPRLKQLLSFRDFMKEADPFPDPDHPNITDPFKVHAWVNIAITTLMRNIGRAVFQILKNGDPLNTGPIYTLFRDVNPDLNRFDLWKITAAWWYLEGEAFWFFGDSYTAGIPTEIHILNPRKIRPLIIQGKVKRWFYSTDYGEIPILPDEIIHFKDWNPWNEHRGVTPLIALNEEIAQDYHANRTTTRLMKNNAVPEGLLKTDQVLREEEADKLEKRWENTYGRNRKSRSIAVLGKGTTFEPLSVTPEALKFFELKRWNLYTILARYGIPPRVANVQDYKGSFAGKDTAEQHSAFWKYTILPTLKNFEQILETQFFARFNLTETGTFDTSDIPELQESANERSKRDIAEINAGIKTINDVLKERGLDEKPWGNIWYRPSKLVPTGIEATPEKQTHFPNDELKSEYQNLIVEIQEITDKYQSKDTKNLKNNPETIKTLKKETFSAGYALFFQNHEAGGQNRESLINKDRELINSLDAIAAETILEDVAGWIFRIFDSARIEALKDLGESHYLRLVKNERGWHWKIQRISDHRQFQRPSFLTFTESRYLSFHLKEWSLKNEE
ncbi:MAG: phage portal protein [Spirochaetales bacterium]|nr:phage portal protein [Spirochaetales bacterium]